MAIARQLAPVPAPPPPKPPQLNLVASALMPDVRTDTFGPGAGPQLAPAPALVAAGWSTSRDGTRSMWHRPPGDTAYRRRVEEYNRMVAAIGAMGEQAYKQWIARDDNRLAALVAAVGVMDDLDLQQSEVAPGVTADSLPASIFPATAGTRWTGGFQYAPENQYPGVLADPCGQTIDLPALAAPTSLVAVEHITGGTLTNAASPYDYVVTAKNANGETLGSTPATATIASGTAGSVSLTWAAVAGPPGTITYQVYGRKSGLLGVIHTTTGLSYTDTGAASVGPDAPPDANTTGGPGNYGNLPLVGYVPFLIQAEDECSTFGWETRDYVGRALRLLDNATPNAIEREFWSGGFAQNPLTGPFDGTNAFLTQSGTPSDGGTGVNAVDLTPGSGATPCSITRGIQILEDYLANSGFGGQGMLHVAPETSPNLLGARRVGALLLTVMDNIVVPGSGYPTSGATGPIGNDNADPGDGNAWIFCSDLVSIRLDDPMVWPSTMAEAVDRGNFGSPNTVRIRAQRFAAATFDVARLAACRVVLGT